MSARQYWPKLKIVMKIAVRYYDRWSAKLPSDLRLAGDSAILTMRALLTLLELYDASHAGGEPQDDVTEGF